MPQFKSSKKPFKICREFSCNNLTKDSYCKNHEYIQREKELRRYKDYSSNRRNKEHHAFYTSKEWRALREYVMMIYNYLCIDCPLTPADVVDHDIPITVDWSLRLTISNCKPRCHACHNKKTAEDRKKYA